MSSFFAPTNKFHFVAVRSKVTFKLQQLLTSDLYVQKLCAKVLEV